MFYARYVALCSDKNISPSKVAIECGFNKGSVSIWKKKYEKGEDVKPTPEILIKIANYFNVSVGYLLDVEDNPVVLTTCPICGFQYDSNDEVDTQQHNQVHLEFITAKKYFGDEYVIRPREREKKKSTAWNVINNSSSYSLDDVKDAVIDLYACWFSRSLSANDYSLNHPEFDEYVSMLLFQSHQKEIIFKKVPIEVQNALVKKYGQKPGIPNGKTVFLLRNEEAESKIIDFPVATDEQIKFALFGGDEEITDEILDEVKAFAQFVKNKYKKD